MSTPTLKKIEHTAEEVASYPEIIRELRLGLQVRLPGGCK
jgi:hypothetical protein